MSKVETFYLIHHSHTDLGFTHDLPIVMDLQMRFIDEGLRLAEKYADGQSAGAFRWTVETTVILENWLKHASARQIERFVAMERSGRIEVTGMFANLTPALDTGQLIESFQLLRRLRDQYGFTIRHGMNCDVNGEAWPLVDLLVDLGIQGFSMAINTHFGGAPLHRPDVFWWQGPSGRKVLAYNGWPYDQGWRFGIGRDADLLEKTWWPRVERRLDEIGYPLPVLMVQSYHPFGDNGPAFEQFSSFIDAWNAQGKSPRLVFATPALWWEAVKPYAQDLPTFRGDWTDYWNFGSISSAREEATNRRSRARLRAADALAAADLVKPNAAPATRRAFDLYRESAWWNLNLWGEHTWGADVAIVSPGNEDTVTQWEHKAHFAYQARSLSLLLQRDALADFARYVPRAGDQDLLLFNPLPWPRVIAGEVPRHVLEPRGVAEDATAGRHSQDRRFPENFFALPSALAADPSQATRRLIKPQVVPGYGYTVVPRAGLAEESLAADFSEEAVVENDHHRITFDLERGGITSWYDKRLGREWVDSSAGYPLHGYVHEAVADRAAPWPRHQLFYMKWEAEELERPSGWKTGWQAERAGTTSVVAHRVHRTPLGRTVVQVLEAPGIVGPLLQTTCIPDFAEWVEFESWWDMGLTAHPESTYLLFPFDVPGAVAHLDLGGVAMSVDRDQIPGVCRDYFTVQQWVDFSNDALGVTIATPDNPLVQLGDFHYADYQQQVRLERAMLLGWVTNNYWETNFRAHQPGRVAARYRVLPHAGGFDETQAHRFGLDAAYNTPLVQHLGEPALESALPPGSGALLDLPAGDVLTMHVKPGSVQSGLVVRLINVTDRDAEATLASAALEIQGASLCDLLEHPVQPLTVRAGSLTIEVAARRVATVHLDVGMR